MCITAQCMQEERSPEKAPQVRGFMRKIVQNSMCQSPQDLIAREEMLYEETHRCVRLVHCQTVAGIDFRWLLRIFLRSKTPRGEQVNGEPLVHFVRVGCVPCAAASIG